VSFASGRGLVPSDNNDHADIYTATFSHGSVTVQRVSVSTHGAQGNANSVNSGLSPNGRYVAFMSTASTLVPGDTNRVSDLFLHDRRTGVTTRVDVGPNGQQANARNETAPEFIAVQTPTGGGAIVAFESGASNLLARHLSPGSRITHG
jgi:Tol biopolymer transport system component